MTITACVLLAFTVLLLDGMAVLLYLWSMGAVTRAETQRDSYKLVSQVAVRELTEIQDLLVRMVEEEASQDAAKKLKKKAVDTSWD